MKLMTVPRSDLTCSRLIFGTGSLFNAGTARDRALLLHRAVEAGFTHIDTAPYYGFGVAERDLAPVLKAHPHVTVTTKVGIYSPGGEAQPTPAVFLRKAAGRVVSSASRPTVDFSLAKARHALEGSLRRLGRERVDFYALHEPETALLDFDEWRRWLEDCTAQGKIRQFGAALTAERLEGFLAGGVLPGQVLQVSDSLERREADILARHGWPMQITYGYLGSALRSPSPPSVADVLRAALRRNRAGAIVVSTTKPGRPAELARIAEEADLDP